MIASPLALAAAIAGCTALGLWLEHRFGWARKTGASLLVIASGAVLANAGLVPAASPVYGAVAGAFVGMLAAALTEVLNVWPILAKRIGLAGRIVWLLMAMVLGKVIDSLFQWIFFTPLS